MILAVCLLASFFFLAIAMAAPRRKNKLPASEQFVLSLLHFAAWIERIATSLDVAIVRYRIEKRCLVIDMESTRLRVSEGE